MSDVVIINYGAGNLRSVSQALEHCGTTPFVSDDPEVIAGATKIILPGVGAFPAAMQELQKRGLDEAIRQAVSGGSLLMGICLGMQLLFESSNEFKTTCGLGLIPGTVTQIPLVTGDGRPRKVPHIGWNELVASGGSNSWGNTVLRDVPQGAPVYFLHSFMANPASPTDRMADGMVDDLPVTAVAQRDNVIGCQFHPEKSGAVGLRIFQEFLRL